MDKKKIFWQIFHATVISIFVLQILYCMCQFFFVFTAGQLICFGSAVDLPYETMVVRRLYAIELWISFIGLVVYIAIVFGRKKE
ncbi:MAG: hypothetical protein JW776_04190 [Candidatus Lokiarchaeota archaeon]|nr:hypothetical protein [Candidatus Lokiarchaeota archaeon]